MSTSTPLHDSTSTLDDHEQLQRLSSPMTPHRHKRHHDGTAGTERKNYRLTPYKSEEFTSWGCLSPMALKLKMRRPTRPHQRIRKHCLDIQEPLQLFPGASEASSSSDTSLSPHGAPLFDDHASAEGTSKDVLPKHSSASVYDT